MTPTAQQCAALAAQVYADDPEFGQPSGPARARRYGPVLAFRGTDNISTAIADADAVVCQVDQLGGVHDGFWRALSTVLPALLAQPEPESVIVGHSEGGALAILYAAVRCLLGRPPAVVCGFEPPRVCVGPEIAALLHGRVTTFFTRNGNDVVTMLPPNLTLPGDLIKIGVATSVLPNVTDHEISRVVAALAES